MQHAGLNSQCSTRGMTLLEVMVATVIIGLVMGSLMVTFRTATRSYDIGITHSEGSQSVRFAVTQLAEDLRNIYYKNEAEYNVTRRQREQLQAERERQVARSGDDSQVIDEQMPELGPRVDLSFIASDNGDTDDISFVRLQGPKRSEDRKMWGLARVRYFIAGEKLYRAVDDVRAPEVDEEGNEIPKPYPPTIDKISNNVKGLDLKFGYYYDKEWHLADNWDSNATQYRNPVEEDEYDEDIISTTAAGGFTSGSQQLKPDAIPAWVEITYRFSDPRKEEREKVFHQVVQLATSEETYEPKDELEDQNMFGRRRRGDNR